ncbi:transporter substrate-binding domain-containing protein [Anaerolentibacter hominis]|uniref:transporter substrate-binding domain-containing protein n=1 Tax=Anaerolentibacter hominis TaxID=3079009 RepID=UPI0031B82056
MNKKMKRVLAFLCVMTMAATALTGCGKKKADSYVALSDTLAEEEYGVGFRKEDIAFGLKVQEVMDEMIEDGTALELSEKWFGRDTLLKDVDYIKETSAPAEDDSWTKIQEKGTFIVGLDDSYPPMGFRDESGELAGYDIDLAKEVAKRLGVEVEFQPIDWDSKEMELTSGKVDCLWNGMTITDERVEVMFFAKPYIANEQIIIVPEGSDVKTRADMKGKVVGLQKGSSSYDAVINDPVGSEVKEIKEYANNVDAYNDLKAGRIDVFVVDSVVGNYMLTQDSSK